jgi:hypothetical protein
MSRHNELVREALKILAAHGHDGVVSNGGKHIKLTWLAHGQRRILTISKSPGDYRARLKSRTLLRRLLRAEIAAQLLDDRR